MKLHKLISTVDMSHEEWLRYRKLGIGGSDAGSICGLNPYSSAIAVFQDKTQKEAGEKEDNEAMRQGRDLEEYLTCFHGRDREKGTPCQCDLWASGS